MRKLILLIIALLLMNAFCVMADSKLNIAKVEITSGGKTLLSTSSSSGHFEVQPGDELKVKIRLDNNFAESTHTDISEIRVKATMEGLDESDDSDLLSVRADGERTVTLRLDIDDDASAYESYYLVITAEGKDEQGVLQEDEVSYDVEVNREDHELVFNELEINDVDCGETGTLRIEIENNGEEDEQDVTLKVKVDQLGTVFTDDFDIDAWETYSKTKRLDLDGLSGGSHTVTVTVEYADGDEELEDEIEFSVEGCGTSSRSRYTDYGYDFGETETVKKKEVVTEPYTNPNRDLRFLFTPEVQPVELVMPPMIPKAPRQQPVQAESNLSIIVLLLANIALIIFIALILRSVYNR